MHYEPAPILQEAAAYERRDRAWRGYNAGSKQKCEEGAGWRSETSAKKPRKERSVYSDKDRAAIGRYAAENGNTMVQKHFKSKYPELGESTVLSFKQKYLSLVASGKSTVTSIPNKRMGRPLALGDLDQEVQKYIRALRATGTAISVPLILAAAQGIIEAKDRTLLVEH